MAIVSQQNWLIKKIIMEDIFKKLPKLSLDTPFYGTAIQESGAYSWSKGQFSRDIMLAYVLGT